MGPEYSVTFVISENHFSLLFTFTSHKVFSLLGYFFSVI